MSAAPNPSGSGKGGKVRSVLADRRFAAGVLALVVLVLTPVGARRSLKGAVRNVEAGFFTGVDGRGAVAEYLEDAENAATGLISIGARYEAAEEETVKLRADKHRLDDVMAGRDVSAHASAYGLMARSFNALREKLLSLELSAADAEHLADYAMLFDNAEGAIPHSGYNEAVEEFIADIYNHFPARLIRSALGVAPPEKFQ